MSLTSATNGKQSLITKVLIILFGHLWEVELTYRYIFAFKFTWRSQQPDIVPIICRQCQRYWRQICHWCQRHQWQFAIPLFAAGVVDIGGKLPLVTLTPVANLPPVSLTPVANLQPVSTTLAKLLAKFAAGVLDNGGKYAAGVVDTGGASWLANISANFWKNSKRS